MANAPVSTELPQVYHVGYVDTSGTIDTQVTSLHDRDHYELDATIASLLTHQPVVDAIRAGEYHNDVLVLLCDTLDEAQAFLLGVSTFADCDDVKWTTQQRDGYAIAMVVNSGADEPDLRYLDRRGGQSSEEPRSVL